MWGDNMSVMVFGSNAQYQQICHLAPKMQVVHGLSGHQEPRLVVVFGGQMSDRDILKDVVGRWPEAPIVMISERVDQEHFMMALKWGVKEYVIGDLDQQQWDALVINLQVLGRS